MFAGHGQNLGHLQGQVVVHRAVLPGSCLEHQGAKLAFPGGQSSHSSGQRELLRSQAITRSPAANTPWPMIPSAIVPTITASPNPKANRTPRTSRPAQIESAARSRSSDHPRNAAERKPARSGSDLPRVPRSRSQGRAEDQGIHARSSPSRAASSRVRKLQTFHGTTHLRSAFGPPQQARVSVQNKPGRIGVFVSDLVNRLLLTPSRV